MQDGARICHGGGGSRHCLHWQGGVRADSWPAAQVKEVFSASREWFVLVVPGKSVGETVGFASAPIGKHATAEFYRRSPALLLPDWLRKLPSRIPSRRCSSSSPTAGT